MTFLIVDPETRTIEKLALSSEGIYESSDASSLVKVTVCQSCAIEFDATQVFSA